MNAFIIVIFKLQGLFLKKCFNYKIARCKNATCTTSPGARSLQDNMSSFPRTLQLDLSFHMLESTCFISLFYPVFTLPFPLSTLPNFSECTYSPQKMQRTQKMLYIHIYVYTHMYTHMYIYIMLVYTWY